MTTHAAAYESITARHPGTATVRPDSGWSEFYPNVTLPAVAGNHLLVRGLVPISGYSAIPVTSLLSVYIGDTTITHHATRNTWVTQVTSTPAAAVIDNVTQFIIKGDVSNSGVNSGRLSPRIKLDFNGVTTPANPTSLDVAVNFAYADNPYMGLCHFCEFEEWPPDSVTDPNARLRELINLFNQATATYDVGESGSPLVMNYCGFAACAPEGAVIVRPEDIGAGANQIPTDLSDNTAAKFRAHPSVFYPAGKAPYVRSLFRQAVDSIAADQGSDGGPLEITRVDSAPTFSNWLVVVDGQAQILGLNHPAGSDYRRPRDIWNNVWIPIITGDKSAAGAVTFEGASSSGGSIGFRWDYADYFRCLPIAGTNIIQTGSG